MVNGPVGTPDRQNHRRKDDSLTWVGGLSLPDGKTTVGSTLDVEARRDFWKAAHERLWTYVPDGDRSRIETSLAGTACRRSRQRRKPHGDKGRSTNA